MSEQHVGSVMAHMNGNRVEKRVYCHSWRGGIYAKQKGNYGEANMSVNYSGQLGAAYSWTDLVLFEGWSKLEQNSRNIRVINIVEATKERLGVSR